MTQLQADDEEREEIAIHLVLETLRLCHGQRFQEYSPKTMRRRLQRFILRHNVPRIVDLVPRLLHEERLASQLIPALTVPVSAMFRDPPFFTRLRHEVLETLRPLPALKIWLVGCATGEEAYSLAILLHEEGLLSKTQLLASDLNEEALARARAGNYHQAEWSKHETNYRLSAGQHELAVYGRFVHGSFHMDDTLKNAITFFRHDLTVDPEVAGCHLILCRNVLIYFTHPLQERCLRLFWESLLPEGILALGFRETLHPRLHSAQLFAPWFAKERIFRKRGSAVGMESPSSHLWPHSVTA